MRGALADRFVQDVISMRGVEKFYDTRAGRSYVLRRIDLDVK